jgi:hypothetical protein
MSGTPDAVCIGLRDRSTTTPGKRSILDNKPLGIKTSGAFSMPENGGSRMKCISCRFALVDKKASDRDWTAYQCGNPKSEYYRALINTSPEGKKHQRISWSGCEHGERKVKMGAKKTLKTLSPSRLPGANGGQVLSRTHERIQPALQPGRKARVFQKTL